MNSDDTKLIALLERIADALDRAYPKPEPETDLTRLRRAFPAWRWTSYMGEEQIVGTSDSHLCHFIVERCEGDSWRARLMLRSETLLITRDCETPLRAVHILMKDVK